jgi:hypothetical protein
MINLFLPYELALELKNLGFNEPCLFDYNRFNTEHLNDSYFEYANYNTSEKMVSAPLFQQVFKWFREKYNLDASMSVNVWGEKQTSYRITGGIKGVIEANSYGALYDIDTEYYNSYEEAELECLKKLIEIVKEKK